MNEHSYSPNWESQSGGGTALDTSFSMLGDGHRRRILTSLVDDDPSSVAEFLLATDHDDPETARIALYHHHLPKLDEAEYVDWDDEARTFRRGPRFDEVAPMVRLLRDNQDRLPTGWP